MEAEEISQNRMDDSDTDDSCAFDIESHDEDEDILPFGSVEECRDDALERLCKDEGIPGLRFCQVNWIHGEANKVYLNSKLPDHSSASQSFANHPPEGISVAVNSVFRGRRQWETGSATFTAFLASPLVQTSNGSDWQGIAFTAAHCYDKPVDSVTGRVGVFVSASSLRSGIGFSCSTSPLVLCDTFACFEVSADDSTRRDTLFLLPCSPTELPIDEPYVATFSYPGISAFLNKAREELVMESEDHGIWERYKVAAEELGQSKGDLYKVFRGEFADVGTGELVCSAGCVKNVECLESRLLLKVSTLPGGSGGPLVPAALPGYFVGIVDCGDMQADFNYGTSTDAPEFVEAYREYVLPYLPPLGTVAWEGRDTAAFERWLAKHKLALIR